MVRTMVDVQLFHQNPFIPSIGHSVVARSILDSKVDTTCVAESEKEWPQIIEHWWLECWTRLDLCNHWFIFSWKVHWNIDHIYFVWGIWICRRLACSMVARSGCKHVGICFRMCHWKPTQTEFVQPLEARLNVSKNGLFFFFNCSAVAHTFYKSTQIHETRILLRCCVVVFSGFFGVPPLFVFFSHLVSWCRRFGFNRCAIKHTFGCHSIVVFFIGITLAQMIWPVFFFGPMCRRRHQWKWRNQQFLNVGHCVLYNTCIIIHIMWNCLCFVAQIIVNASRKWNRVFETVI